jgi:hypothetical protein
MAALEELSKLGQEIEAMPAVELQDNHVDLSGISISRELQDNQAIKNKLRASRNYCVRFYQTFCNNELHKGTFSTGYSWRATGGLIADLIGQGDYMDWYCSGGEGLVDEEVEADLAAMGWVVKPYEGDDGV